MRNTKQIDAMRDAIKEGNIGVVQRLLDEGFPIDQTLSYAEQGYSALNWCTGHRQTAIAALLLERGADPAVATPKGETPLHFSLVLELIEMARILIKAGAPVNALTKQNKLPLHLVSTQEECLMLLEAGAHTSLVPEEVLDRDPLYLTPFQTLFQNEGGVPLAHLMFEHGNEDPYQKTVNGRTLDELCVNRPEMASFLRAMRIECQIRQALLTEIDDEVSHRPRAAAHL